jgi:hypothetical protein
MILKLAMAVVALIAGGWMIFDGIHVLVRGKYFGPDRPGPWSVPFARLGVNPFSLGPLFIGIGVLWLAFAVAALAGLRWGRGGGAAIAIASLWYFPLGTILSLMYLALLFATRAG